MNKPEEYQQAEMAEEDYWTHQDQQIKELKLELEVVKACWDDYLKVVREFGFSGKCSGGVNRWVQDRLTKNNEKGELIKHLRADNQSFNDQITQMKGERFAIDKLLRTALNIGS